MLTMVARVDVRPASSEEEHRGYTVTDNISATSTVRSKMLLPALLVVTVFTVMVILVDKVMVIVMVVVVVLINVVVDWLVDNFVVDFVWKSTSFDRSVPMVWLFHKCVLFKYGYMPVLVFVCY